MKYLSYDGLVHLLSLIKTKLNGKAESEHTHTKSDITDFPEIPIVPINVSAFKNDKGYLSAIPSDYKTKTENDALYQPVGNYVKPDDIPKNVSQLNNDRGYLSAIPSDYKTKTENDALYQPIGNYAKPSDIPTNISAFENDKGYLVKVPDDVVKNIINEAKNIEDPVCITLDNSYYLPLDDVDTEKVLIEFLNNALKTKDYDVLATTATLTTKIAAINQKLDVISPTGSNTVNYIIIDSYPSYNYVTCNIYLTDPMTAKGLSNMPMTGINYKEIYFTCRYSIYLSKEEIENKKIENLYRYSDLKSKSKVYLTSEKYYVSDSMASYIPTNNNRSYTPTNDYNPATKKYVDDTVKSAITDALEGSY